MEKIEPVVLAVTDFLFEKNYDLSRFWPKHWVPLKTFSENKELPIHVVMEKINQQHPRILKLNMEIDLQK